MEQYGNQSTYNLETVLKQNINNADFYKNDCLKLNSWSEVIDQIFYQRTGPSRFFQRMRRITEFSSAAGIGTPSPVDYVEPWLAGNARGPSTAFCLLYRLFELKPTEEEVQATINHEDSVYIRAVGFLYLRYVADPRQLWTWLGPYCDDKEEIQPSGPNGPVVTVGDFVRDLLLEQYYYETIFPRIPKKVEDDIQAELRRRGLPTKGKGNGGCGGPDRRGGDEGNRRPASVKASLSVAFGQRAPNRAGTKAWKDERIKAVAGDGRDKGRDRSRDPSREPAAAAADDRRGGERAYGRSGSRERPRERYDSRDRERERDRNGRDYDSRRGDREQYDRGSGREYDRGSGRDRREYDRRDYDRRDYDRREYDRRDRSSRDEPRRRSSRSRSRSRDRSRGGGRDASDVFKERVGGTAATDVRARYGDASGKLDLGPSGGGKRSADEVFRLGGRSYR